MPRCWLPSGKRISEHGRWFDGARNQCAKDEIIELLSDAAKGPGKLLEKNHGARESDCWNWKQVLAKPGAKKRRMPAVESPES